MDTIKTVKREPTKCKNEILANYTFAKRLESEHIKDSDNSIVKTTQFLKWAKALAFL